MAAKDIISEGAGRLIQQGARLLEKRMRDNQTTDASNGEGSVHAPGGIEASSAGDLGPAGSGSSGQSIVGSMQDKQTTDVANGAKPKGKGTPNFGMF
jgi:hypothetical protein